MAIGAIEDELLFDRDMLEGNWTTYIHRWQRALTTGGGGLWCVLHLDTLHNCLYQAWRDGAANDRLGIYQLNDGTVIFEAPAAADYLANLNYVDTFSFISNTSNRFLASSHARYVVIVRDNEQDFEVWKDGAVLFTDNITVYEIGAQIQSIIMSQDGKWLVMLSDLGLIHVWEAI